MSPAEQHKRYWRANLTVLSILLAIWFISGCVLSIFLVEPLNQIKMAGFPIGFWISQQGTIIVFIALILAYVIIMKRLDRKYGVEEKGQD